MTLIAMCEHNDSLIFFLGEGNLIAKLNVLKKLDETQLTQRLAILARR